MPAQYQTNYMQTYPAYYAYNTYNPPRQPQDAQKRYPQQKHVKKDNKKPLIAGAAVFIILLLIASQTVLKQSKISDQLNSEIKDNSETTIIVAFYYDDIQQDKNGLHDYFNDKGWKIVAIRQPAKLVQVEMPAGEALTVSKETWVKYADVMHN